jgi:uncharacterized protein YtpQ (UPF0354 family)
MYLQAAVSQVEIVREKSLMEKSKLNIVLSSDTFQFSTFYFTQEQCNYFAQLLKTLLVQTEKYSRSLVR